MVTILAIIITAATVHSQYEHVQKFLAWAFGLFCRFGSTFERLHIKENIQSKINLFSKRTFKEIGVKEKQISPSLG